MDKLKNLRSNLSFLTKDETDKFKKDLVAGTVSGAMSATATHSLDNWVVRAQTGTGAVKVPLTKSLQALGGRITKGVATAGTGYPVFMYVSKKLESDPEVVKSASAIAVGRGALNFAKGFTVLGSPKSLLTVPGATGLGTSMGLSMKFSGQAPTKLESISRLPRARLNNFRINQTLT